VSLTSIGATTFVLCDGANDRPLVTLSLPDDGPLTHDGSSSGDGAGAGGSGGGAADPPPHAAASHASPITSSLTVQCAPVPPPAAAASGTSRGWQVPPPAPFDGLSEPFAVTLRISVLMSPALRGGRSFKLSGAGAQGGPGMSPLARSFGVAGPPTLVPLSSSLADTARRGDGRDADSPLQL
jgi:hypothetical protein